MLRKNMLECIGQTPLVRLRLGSGAVGQVYGKLELLNPFGMKDRVAKHLLLEAKRTGALCDEAPIIETSSGTMALGLALVGTYLGHQVHIVTDPRIDPITLAKLKATGCTVHIVEQMTQGGWQGARLDRLHELMNSRNFCDHSRDDVVISLVYTFQAHRSTLAGRVRGKVEALVVRGA